MWRISMADAAAFQSDLRGGHMIGLASESRVFARARIFQYVEENPHEYLEAIEDEAEALDPRA
jgi:hypothetical protein